MATAGAQWSKSDWAIRVIGMIIGIGLGAAVAIWLNQPWIEFHGIEATYTRGSRTVKVYGEYTASKTCSRAEQATPPDAPEPLVWRQEVRSTGTQVAQYAPSPKSPTLQIGRHDFAMEIPLDEGIDPDGWSVAIIVTCDKEPIAARSKSSTVKYLGDAPGDLGL